MSICASTWAELCESRLEPRRATAAAASEEDLRKRRRDGLVRVMKTFSRKYRDNDIGDEEKVQVVRSTRMKMLWVTRISKRGQDMEWQFNLTPKLLVDTYGSLDLIS